MLLTKLSFESTMVASGQNIHYTPPPIIWRFCLFVTFKLQLDVFVLSRTQLTSPITFNYISHTDRHIPTYRQTHRHILTWILIGALVVLSITFALFIYILRRELSNTRAFINAFHKQVFGRGLRSIIKILLKF